jgi:predicted component of type VI protein secretion system
MKRIHAILLIVIALCLGVIAWQHRKPTTEPFQNSEDNLVFTSAQCGFLLNQKKGAEDAKEKAAANNDSTASFDAMISALEAKITAVGCSGNESPGKVPLALPASMPEAEKEAVVNP